MYRTSRALAAAALMVGLAAPVARVQAQTPPAPATVKAEIIRAIESAETKIVKLAERMPQEKYSWHPEGARATSEVFMHVAAGNYTFATFFGATRPEGTTGAVLMKITDKAKVVETLKASFVHIKTAVQNAPDLDKVIKLFGNDATVREAMLVAATHVHEHLGQLIVYARVNGIVPPWTEEQQARQPSKN